jgi:hypothetical protein
MPGESNLKRKSARKDAETQRMRKVFQSLTQNKRNLLKGFLCEISAPLRLCVKVFAFCLSCLKRTHV